MEVDTRNNKLKSNFKWDQFKLDRKQAIKNFVKAKKQIKRTKQMLVLLVAVVLVRKYSQAYKVALYQTMQRKRFQWGAFMIVVHLKSVLRSKFGSMDMV